MKRAFSLYSVFASFLVSITASQMAGAQERIYNAPGLAVQDALKGMGVTQQLKVPLNQADIKTLQPGIAVGPLLPEASDGVEVYELKVGKGSIPEQYQQGLDFDSDGNTQQPLAPKNSFVIILEPNLTDEEVADLVAEKGFTVTETIPAIGGLVAQWDAQDYFVMRAEDTSANDMILRGLVEASQSLADDPRILSAAPNTFVSKFDVETNLLTANRNVGALSDAVDWGIKDARIDKYSEAASLGGPTYLGIMDVGFSPHEDIIFEGLKATTPRNDHGNHVAGIACGIHDNNKGVRGVIPRCIVVADTARYMALQQTPGATVQSWALDFGQLVGNVTNFISTHPEIKTFNLSMGYNWMRLFGFNPDDASSETIRLMVSQQGSVLLATLAVAAEKQQMIFSAAGNDSARPGRAIHATFASAFNWAAQKAREQGIISGIVVEAHDSSGNAAGFSNGPGDISCPGVNILSALAYDDAGADSPKSYGSMSGTSMASPLCAAGFQLLRNLKPNYSVAEIFACATSGSRKNSIGTPIFDMDSAMQACP